MFGKSRKQASWSLLPSSRPPRQGMGRQSPKQRGGDHPSSDNRKGIWYYLQVLLVGATILGALAGCAMAYIQWVEHNKAAEVTNYVSTPATRQTICDGETPAVHAQGYIIDISDPLPGQRARDNLRTEIETDLDETPRGSAILIAGLGDENYQDPLTNVYSGCNPGRGKDSNPLFETERAIEDRYQAFRARAVSSLTREFVPEDKDASPVCEGLVAILREPEMRAATTRRITLVSDLMYHIPVTGPTTYGRSGSFYDAFPDSCQTDLRGVTISLQIIRRDHPNQNAKLIDYWVTSLEALGAIVSTDMF